MRGLAALVLALALALPHAARANWQGFYAAPAGGGTPRAAASGQPAEAICVREILKAQLRHGIPGNLLLGIGLQETGTTRGGQLTVWPYAVNAAGEGRIFDSRADAMGWVSQRQAEGVESIDVGCMQINLRWHPDAFATLEDGFDPAVNVDYAARFLRGLYDKTGDWVLAAGSYHSFSPEKREIYLSALARNQQVANDRIDGFRMLAGAGRGPQDSASRPAADHGARDTADRRTPSTTPARTAPARTGPIWTSALSGGALPKAGPSGAGLPGGGRRGIYSGAELEPVLPLFTRVPAGSGG
ncbi:lytic transglycosylase domain-containing protein [Mesobaculum littorinae]|uniref:Lytic transglycosylase domain-containing protein n=1 Tax=Mesobaculum littorinae TaxID=2486419 RepID=A0A438ADV1_9RHOB|nr:lytic transglycosylase domain-containing protein [Mesobaculum littorinae]RVV96886.1 lytic transglycosylase domain-containing protein [Mesobaculum littorinae]